MHAKIQMLLLFVMLITSRAQAQDQDRAMKYRVDRSVIEAIGSIDSTNKFANGYIEARTFEGDSIIYDSYGVGDRTPLKPYVRVFGDTVRMFCWASVADAYLSLLLFGDSCVVELQPTHPMVSY